MSIKKINIISWNIDGLPRIHIECKNELEKMLKDYKPEIFIMIESKLDTNIYEKYRKLFIEDYKYEYVQFNNALKKRD